MSILGTETVVRSSRDIYELSEGELASEFDDSLYQAIISSTVFQRLKDIRFLGAIDYLLKPNGQLTSRRHTRFQHSLGVARLALAYARGKQLNLHQERLMVAGALLHDVGHAPLSHSLEKTFNKLFQMNHHRVTEAIITGRVPFGRPVSSALVQHRVFPDAVVAVLGGHYDEIYSGLFGSPINIDTIEGISRSYTYISPNLSVPSREKILNACMCLESDNDGSLRTLDCFWEMKDLVYSKLIQSPLSLAADYISQKYVEKNSSFFSRHSYFLSESDLLKQHPALKTQLASLTASGQTGEPTYIEYQKRKFVVNRDIAVRGYEDFSKRYIQSKSLSSVRATI